jgi:TIR domain/Pentapeptide repeats (8 copies)
VPDLSGANLSGADLLETIFVNTNLNDVQGLDACVHHGPSTIDHRTMAISGPLPLAFLRGCGLPDEFIDYLPSLLSQPIQFYSCFISYSTKDQLFVERLHADLQNKNVRCWFAPHDLPIGAKTWDAIDEAIRVRDKVLLVLSQAAIDSDWVEDEVNRAYAEERDRKALVLFPVRIDDSVMTTNEPWARKLRDQRNIGDFLRWEEPSEYNKSLERVLRDLKNLK